MLKSNEVVNPELKKLREDLAIKYQLFMVMLKEKAPKSLYLFNKYVLEAEKGDVNFAKLGLFQKEACNFVQDRADMFKLLLMPRSHLKTKLISIGYPTMKIVNDPGIRVLIYSATWQMATDIHMGIQKNLKGNETIQYNWGKELQIDKAPIWAADRTKLLANNKREPTITAAGISNNLVGGHYDLILMDDVVNRDNIATQDQIEKVITRYKDALDLLEPHGELVILGTRWHDSDLYGWILDKDNGARDRFLVMTKQAFEGNIMTGEGFKPLWEQKFSQQALKNLLKQEGWAHFSAQYMNNPVPEEDAIFKKTWFKYYQPDDIKGTLLNKFLLIDPAISLSKDADYTAMVVVGVDEWNNLFILDITRARLSPNEIIEEIFRLNDKWLPNDVAMEQVAFQKVLGYTLREDPRFKQHPFHITELKPNERNKDQRIKGLQPLYENGKVFHNRTLANNIYLEDELVRFPRSTHDDIIDGLAYSQDVVYPAKQHSRRKQKKKYIY